MSLFTETFTHADAASLTADFTWATQGTQVLGITSNQAAVQVGGAVTGYARMEQDSATSDQFAEMVLDVWTPQATGITQLGLLLRFSSSANSHYDFFASEAPVETAFSFGLYKVTAGVRVSMAETTSFNPAQGDRMRFEVETVGSSAVLRCFLNSAIILSATDSSSPFLTQTRCGLYGLKLIAGDVASTTSLTFGDLNTSHPTPSSLLLIGVGT